jgi:predicted regulator of Ras-like GTPase activity (Roadblock/LC7/MglB family)
MDAVAALADLTEISSQVETAVLVDGEGAVLASTLDDAGRSERLARTAVDLLAAAPAALGGAQRALRELEIALPGGSVFVASEGGRSILATTAPAPTSGLVLYDLRACLRALDPPPKPKAKRTRARKPKAEADTDA